ncbi:lysosomal pro-x [Plasmopara halstedii]|uniref:Lysosomal pro-x n=1 Tax=Plasmopara halstedii TaxID=4781 RepID=A0A0P1A5P3_PLAHL|nr:lysosomal pro-x [Plasmopara halstedii]CEG35432.1 lysosomal pro-x [Plasmopara halstedii]|eukprot:XP_024571801.1 lysosomal pro-x [Plasmopara halstedii]
MRKDMAQEMTPMLPSTVISSRDETLRRRQKRLLVVAVLLATPLLLLAIIFSSMSVASTPASLLTEVRQPPISLDLVQGKVMNNCVENFFKQTLDHFDFGALSYRQRYFVCDNFYRPGGVMFFYVGNEANVELYLNHTGLMWENAKEFGAMLVFAEHRYFGQSVPFGKDVTKHLKYLSTEQVLADYAILITYLKDVWKRDIPVIGFGGSYGGMLGSWFRMKYPHIVDGVIAGSAPILSFLGDEIPPDKESFERIVTRDATETAGSAPNCAANIRRSWSIIKDLFETNPGRVQLKNTLSLCESVRLESSNDLDKLMEWAKSAFDYMAMGNYPYPSSYIMNGDSVLPAYPVRVACSFVADNFAAEDKIGLLSAFSKSLSVYYNSTKDHECYQLSASSNESDQDSTLWDYLFCSELYQPQSVDGVNDMFWPVPWNFTADNDRCKSKWGVEIRPFWATTQYGGRKALRAASNIVFSNGDYDPWSGTGVLHNYSDSVIALSVEGGAHHLDLMFSNTLDPPSVLAVRQIEKQHMLKWTREFYQRKASVTNE